MTPKNINEKRNVVPFHVFAVRGEYFLFDTTNCRFFRIDRLTHDFLILYASLGLRKAKIIIKENGQTSHEMLERFLVEFKTMREFGLFDTIKSYMNLSSAKRKLKKQDFTHSIQDVQLILTEKCNLSCRYCYCRSEEKRSIISRDKEMNRPCAKGAVDFLLRQGTNAPILTFFGGEPLMNKELMYFLMDYSAREAKTAGKDLRYVITTNATLLDDQSINCIVDNNFGLLVSLDGPQKLHDWQCPTKSGNGSYKTAMRNIKKLMEKRPVDVRATLAHPLPDIEKLIKFFLRNGFRNIVLGIASNRKESPSAYDLSCDDLRSLCEQIEHILPWMENYLIRKKSFPPYFMHERWYTAIKDGRIYPTEIIFNCGAAHSTVGVDTNGVLYPCAKFCGLEKWKIGNVSHGLDGHKCKKLWFQFLQCIKPFCGKCWAYPICGGPCIWECAEDDGTFVFNNSKCDFVKRNIEFSAYLYFKVQKHSVCSQQA